MWNKPSKTKEPENLEKAYEYAVFLLSLRLRTIGEMREKMEKRGYSLGVIEQAIDQLHKQKYLDDQKYAEIFLDNLKQYRTLGYFGIKRKLLMKKLPSELIDKILEEGLPREEELVIAKRLLKKQGFVSTEQPQESNGPTYSTFADEQKNKQKQKMINRLKSHGFRSDVIAKLMF